MVRPSERPEAHQQTLEAAHMLECDIKSLSQGVGDAQYPHSHSSSCPQSQSLDRHPRSLSRHRLGRRVIFWKPEVEWDPSERPYRGPQGHSFGIHPKDNDGFPCLPKGRKQYVP